MSDLKKYKVASPLHHDGKRYEIGSEIDLTEAQAATLLALRSRPIEKIEEAASTGDGQPNGEGVAGGSAAGTEGAAVAGTEGAAAAPVKKNGKAKK